jgi:hypothetical protein
MHDFLPGTIDILRRCVISQMDLRRLWPFSMFHNASQSGPHFFLPLGFHCNASHFFDKRENWF